MVFSGGYPSIVNALSEMQDESVVDGEVVALSSTRFRTYPPEIFGVTQPPFESLFMMKATDDFGFKAIEHRMSIHDLDATLLHEFSIDHTLLTCR